MWWVHAVHGVRSGWVARTGACWARLLERAFSGYGRVLGTACGADGLRSHDLFYCAVTPAGLHCAVRQVNHTFIATRKPSTLTRGITSLPSALRCCCTVLELNLQDWSKHQIKLLKISMPIHVTPYCSSATNSVQQSCVPTSEACSEPLVTMPL